MVLLTTLRLSPSSMSQVRSSSPPPSTQRPWHGHQYMRSSMSSSSCMSSRTQETAPLISLRSSSPSAPSTPTTQVLEENQQLRRKISALEETVNHLESAGRPSKRRYEYLIIELSNLTFDHIHTVGCVLHISLDAESVRLWTYITISMTWWQRQANMTLWNLVTSTMLS